MLTRHRTLLLVVLLTALLLVPLSAPRPVAAATPASAFQTISAIGGEVNALAVSGTTAYVGEGAALVVVGVSDPANPARRGRLALPQSPQEIQVIGSLAYVADGAGGLQIIDVSNPAIPALRGSFTTAGVASGITVAGGRAYIAVGAQGLQIVDVSNPAAPALLGSYNDATNLCVVNRVKVIGTLAYLAADCGFQIVDVSSTAAPALRGGYYARGLLRGFQIVGDLAYIARGNYGDSSLLILSVATPAAISKVGEFLTSDTNFDVGLSGHVAYLMSGWVSEVVDITNPGNPTMARFFRGGYNISVEAGRAYLADGVDMNIFDISSPLAPKEYSGSAMVGSARQVQVVGHTAYTLSRSGGLRIVDVSNLTAPTLIGAYDPASGGQFYGLYATGDRAYLTFEKQLLILDVSAPSAPKLLGSYTFNLGGSIAYAFSVFVSGGRAYVGTSNASALGSADKLAIIDVSNPASPVLLSETQMSYPTATVVGDLAYVIASSKLTILNVANPASPTSVGSIDFSSELIALADVQVVGNLAYLAYGNGGGGLKIVDVQNPAAPVVKGAYTLPSPASSVRVSGGVAYIATKDAMLHALDVRNPTVPAELSSYQMPDTINGIDMTGGLIYVASYVGMYVLRAHPDLFPASGAIAPAGGSVTNYDGSVSLSFPAGAVSGATNISYSGQLAPAHGLGLRLGSLRSFTLTATDGGGAPVTQFAQPYTMVVTYTDAELAAAGLSEASLNIAFWDGSAWTNLLPCAGCGVDTVNNKVTVKLNHFTEFALLGAVEYKSYLPLVRR
jgi:hypothetical protein